LPYPYRVVFSYPVDPVASDNNNGSILLNIILYGGMGYLIYKYGKIMSSRGNNEGLDQILNMKKFEAIKP
jgi:hypothetical protein